MICIYNIRFPFREDKFAVMSICNSTPYSNRFLLSFSLEIVDNFESVPNFVCLEMEDWVNSHVNGVYLN